MQRNPSVTATPLSFAILASAAGALVIDALLCRRWKRWARQARVDWAAAIEARDEAADEYARCLQVVQLQQGWAEVYNAKQDHWLTMSAAEKDRVLARERALWAATQEALAKP